MYIPAPLRVVAEAYASAAAARVDFGSSPGPGYHDVRHPLPPFRDARCSPPRHTWLSTLTESITRLFFTTTTSSSSSEPKSQGPDLRKRGDTPLQSTNVTIGVIVGVLLGIFILGTLFFCARYRRSMRFSDNNKKKRRQSRSEGSSKSSKASSTGSSAAPPPAPPAPPPPPPPPPAPPAA